MGLRHMRRGSRWFCEDFLSHKSFEHDQNFRETVRDQFGDAREDSAMPGERSATCTVRDCLANRFAKQSRTRRIPVR